MISVDVSVSLNDVKITNSNLRFVVKLVEREGAFVISSVRSIVVLF